MIVNLPPRGYLLEEPNVDKAALQVLGIYVPALKDLTDFLIDFKSVVETYGFGANALGRKTFKSLCRFATSMEDLLQSLGEETRIQAIAELDEHWETSVLAHVQSSQVLCITLWVVDKILEQEMADNDNDNNVIILATTPTTFQKYLTKLESIVSDSFFGRLRIAIDCSDPEPILSQLNSSPIGKKNISILLNKETVTGQNPLVQITGMRDGLTMTSGTMGFVNFVKFSAILWLGKSDPGLNVDFAKNGVIVHVAENAEEGYKVLGNSFWATHCKNFRIVIIEEDFKTEIIAICHKVRTQYKCYAPIFIKIADANAYETSAALFPPHGFQLVHSFPFIKESSDPNELVSYGFMSPLLWARPEILCANTAAVPALTDSSTGVLHVHTLAAQYLFPMDANGKSDPFLHVFVNSEDTPREKTKVIRKTLFPDWSPLDWKLEVKLNDQLRFEVYDWDRVGGNDFEGLALRSVSQLISCTGDRTQVTIPLRSQDPSNTKKASKVRGTARIECSWTYQEKVTPPVVPKHFGRPLAESIEQAEKDGTLHVVPLTLAALHHEKQTEGLFRLPGSANNVTALQGLIDKGKTVDLSQEPVHDVGSLCKAYFAMLPDTLLPQAFYEEYKEVARIEDIEEKKQKTVQLVSQLPKCNQEIFIDLTNFLCSVAVHSEINFMTPGNLAVCWTPTVITPKSVSNDPEKMLFDSHTTTQFFGWIIEHASELWPPVEVEIPDFKLADTQFSIVPPSRIPSQTNSPLRSPNQLLQRHLAIDETEENSPYLAMIKTTALAPPPAAASTAGAGVPASGGATLAPSNSVSLVDSESTTEEDEPGKPKKGTTGRRSKEPSSSKKEKDHGRLLGRAKSGKKPTSGAVKKSGHTSSGIASAPSNPSITPPPPPPSEHPPEAAAIGTAIAKRGSPGGFVLGGKRADSTPEAQLEAARASAVPIPSTLDVEIAKKAIQRTIDRVNPDQKEELREYLRNLADTL